MRSFVTGSRAYGTPRSDSDIDLVVLVTEADMEKLVTMADKDYGTANQSYREEDARSLRFGNLNLLCVTDRKHFEVWKQGTNEMKEEAPVTREYAVEFLAKLRKRYGLGF